MEISFDFQYYFYDFCKNRVENLMCDEVPHRNSFVQNVIIIFIYKTRDKIYTSSNQNEDNKTRHKYEKQSSATTEILAFG